MRCRISFSNKLLIVLSGEVYIPQCALALRKSSDIYRALFLWVLYSRFTGSFPFSTFHHILILYRLSSGIILFIKAFPPFLRLGAPHQEGKVPSKFLWNILRTCFFCGTISVITHFASSRWEPESRVVLTILRVWQRSERGSFWKC